MSFSYRKRISLGKGFGINVGNRGISTSYRAGWGSVGSRGFSLRTGIRGLNYRGGWGKGNGGLILLVAGGFWLLMWLAQRMILLCIYAYNGLRRKYR